MIKKILLTGSSGLIGRNVLPILSHLYEISAPTRGELDLKDGPRVFEYVQRGNFNAIIHCANPNPVKNPTCDATDSMFFDSLHIFVNLRRAACLCEKMLYLGSGAEFDKRWDIAGIEEEDFGRSVPVDDYGFSKYIMNELTRGCGNLYNLRIFGCYGPHDHESKFITHAIHCCMRDAPITIRQDCFFDYMQVFDLAHIMVWFLENRPDFKDYNVCTGEKMRLWEIAQKVRTAMGSPHEICILSPGMNREYTANNERLQRELKHFSFTPIDEGIQMQIEWEREVLK